MQLSAWPDDDRRSRIVLITRGLERPEVEETWAEYKQHARGVPKTVAYVRRNRYEREGRSVESLNWKYLSL